MTSATRGARAAAGALALVLVRAAPAPALDVQLWPLFRYTRDASGERVRLSLLGPLVEATRGPRARDLRVRPLLWLDRRRGTRAEVLYPLAAIRREPGYQSARFVLLTFRAGPDPDAGDAPARAWRRRFTLFPLVFYRQSADGERRLGVLPFYLDLEEFFGYERVTTVMFPVYLRLSEPRLVRHFFPFPFLSAFGGADGRGLRLWPLWGDTEIAGRERVRYVLWPFHIRAAHLVPGYGWERRRLDLPFYAAIDGAGRESRFYGMGYMRSVDARRSTESVGTPWPLAVRERALGESAYRVWRIWPVYGRSDYGGISSRFYGWPGYRRRTQDQGDFHYERRDLGFVLWRRQAEHNEASGRREDLLAMFPLLRSHRRGGARRGQVPAPADSLMPRNRGILGMWAPLWALVRWDERPAGAGGWSVLWGLVAREGGRLRGPWYVDTRPVDLPGEDPADGG